MVARADVQATLPQRVSRRVTHARVIRPAGHYRSSDGASRPGALADTEGQPRPGGRGLALSPGRHPLVAGVLHHSESPRAGGPTHRSLRTMVQGTPQARLLAAACRQRPGNECADLATPLPDRPRQVAP